MKFSLFRRVVLSSLSTLVSGFSDYVSSVRVKSDLFSEEDYQLLLETMTDVLGCTSEERRTLFENAFKSSNNIKANTIAESTPKLGVSFIQFLEDSTLAEGENRNG